MHERGAADYGRITAGTVFSRGPTAWHKARAEPAPALRRILRGRRRAPATQSTRAAMLSTILDGSPCAFSWHPSPRPTACRHSPRGQRRPP